MVASIRNAIKAIVFVIILIFFVYVLARGFNAIFIGNGFGSQANNLSDTSKEDTPTQPLPPGQYGPRKRFPDVVIAGAKKCGTTALLFMLTSAHDSVRQMLGNESHFYDRHFDKGLSWYLDKMPVVSDNEIVLEKTPNYLTTSFAAEEIQKMGSRVILMLCNPITRVLSDYGHHMRKIKNPPYPSIEDMLLDSQGNINATSSILIPSLYSDHLPTYMAYFPLGEKLHIVDGDNFALSPWEEVGLVEEFLSLSPVLANASSFHRNTKEGKEKLFCWNVTKGKKKQKCLEAARGMEHAKLDKDLEEKLRDYLQPYNEKLFVMLGRTFDWSDYY